MPPWAQRIWSLVRQLQAALGGNAIRVGTASGTWPGGSPRADDTTVTHGLGKTPTIVLATVTASPSGTWFPVVATITYTDTTFKITAVTSDGSSPAAATAYSVAWEAVG